MNKYVYVVYDNGYHIDPDGAEVFFTTKNLEDAREYVKENTGDEVIVRYEEGERHLENPVTMN